MISGFIAKKGHMTNVFDEKGRRLTVTNCITSPLFVTQIKTNEKDGYSAIQVAYGTKKHTDRSQAAKIKKLKLKFNPFHYQEFQSVGDAMPEVGSQIDISNVFQIGDAVNVTGISKGRGFAGVIKRHGFQRQPVSGGQSDRVRAPGAIGAQTPGKVIKGKKMPGHYGHATAHVANLKIIAINPETQEIQLNGPVPGHYNSWITIQKT